VRGAFIGAIRNEESGLSHLLLDSSYLAKFDLELSDLEALPWLELVRHATVNDASTPRTSKAFR